MDREEEEEEVGKEEEEGKEEIEEGEEEKDEVDKGELKEEGAQAAWSLLSSSLFFFSASSLFLRSSSSSSSLLLLLCSSVALLLLTAASSVSCMNCWVVAVPPMCTLLLLGIMKLLLLLEEKLLDCCSVKKLSGFHTDSTDSCPWTPPCILHMEKIRHYLVKIKFHFFLKFHDFDHMYKFKPTFIIFAYNLNLLLNQESGYLWQPVHNIHRPSKAYY